MAKYLTSISDLRRDTNPDKFKYEQNCYKHMPKKYGIIERFKIWLLGSGGGCNQYTQKKPFLGCSECRLMDIFGTLLQSQFNSPIATDKPLSKEELEDIEFRKLELLASGGN